MALSGGIDYLKGRVFGSLADSAIFEKLEVCKQLAHDRSENVFAKFGGLEFAVCGHAGGGVGKESVKFWLEWAGLRFGVVAEKYSDDSKVALGWFEVRGEPLSRLGYVNVRVLLQQAFKALGWHDDSTKLTRVDIRHDFDFFTPQQIHAAAVGGKMITRFSSYITYGTDPANVQTVQLGKRGQSSVLTRIYDKWAEAGNSEAKKKFVRDVLCGGEEVETLTRVEFELSRDALLKHGIDSLDDLEGGVGRLCEYLTEEYLRMSSDVVDRKNTSRAKVSKGWEQVSGSFGDWASKFLARPQKVVKRSTQTFNQAKNTVVGYIAKMFALGNRSAVNAFPVSAAIHEIFDEFELSDFQKRIDDKAKEFDWIGDAERALWGPPGQRFMEFAP